MPTLLSIPREIRDQIYDWTLSDTLASSRSRDMRRERKCLIPFPFDPETLFGEDAVQYPVHTSLPPAHGLLHTTRQIRHEFLEGIKRLSNIRYKVDLLDRKDRGVLAPTWISVPCLPCFTDRIDVLEVNWRVRHGKTSSIVTSVGESDYYLSNSINGSLALLQRFVERGVYLLSKKKRRKVHIGLLEIHLNGGADIDEEALDEFAIDACSFLDDYLLGEVSSVYYDDEKRQTFDEQFEMLASKIDRIQIYANSTLKQEWGLHDAVAKREEHARRLVTRDYDST
ncbi:hypothetical protein NA56DRAFT_646573 [Hyaloscypha hepaticicola]|uniref:F-box domain-containing protein n=1 Tax=Hyaloscypha hepaticicola TaxID=2082293 RepID=A0A2J6Q2N1_9HELO|nr:hypothetical protein NA56DRAFT_646573 [Hyaloscypha hepaticicola]